VKMTMQGGRCRRACWFLEQEGKEEEEEEEGRLRLGVFPRVFVHRSLRLRDGKKIGDGINQRPFF
jgi:hypothetical protein